jgi:hypothetical protein
MVILYKLFVRFLKFGKRYQEFGIAFLEAGHEYVLYGTTQFVSCICTRIAGITFKIMETPNPMFILLTQTGFKLTIGSTVLL